MSDTKNPGDKTLHMSPKTLTLKRPVEQGVVRQSFSHGRSKAVVVETVKRRVVGPGTAPPAKEAPAPQAPTPASERASPATGTPTAPASRPRPAARGACGCT